ncbi:MAG: hypothetical protein HKP27_11975 [Myxococcales bacterium]|nr:hypothetical protein [Myxococcales bacterium]
MAYGLAIAAARQSRPNRLLRLEPLCVRFGSRRGALLHGLAYTSAPIAAGMWLAFEGARLL